MKEKAYLIEVILMNMLTMIALHVIVPVFLLVGVGVFIHRKFQLDMYTLSKLNTYLLLPAVSFVNIYESNVNGSAFVQVMIFLIFQNGCMILLTTGLSKVLKFEPSLSSTFKNSIVLNNSGNYGLPVSQLVFYQNPFGASIQVVVTLFQNMLTYTYGLLNAVSVQSKGSSAVKQFLKNPIFYAFLLGLIFHGLSIKLPGFIWTPITNISDAFLAIALITLGAQSAYLKINYFSLPLVLSLIGRLILSPLIAFFLLTALHIEGTIAQALLIASSYPSSRNSALFALEYDNHPEYATQAVILSTLLSGITVTITIYIAKIIFL
jgi:predicted permease